MAIDSFLPQINMLRADVEKNFGKKPRVHNDFVALAEDVSEKTGSFISAITLERLWQYSTRTSEKVLLHTLNVLSNYSENTDWEGFCENLKSHSAKESDMFDDPSIDADTLHVDDRIRLAWLPDRVCTIRYLGKGRFVAEECENSTMQPGDTFSCKIFQLLRPLYLDDFETASGEKRKRYAVGLNNGLTSLKLLK